MHLKSVLTSLRSRDLDASIILDGVIPHPAIELLKLLGVPGREQQSLLTRLIQDNMRDVHRLFTLHKVFTLRIWTQAGVAFRSLPDNRCLKFMETGVLTTSSQAEQKQYLSIHHATFHNLSIASLLK